jgi:raffinose/stachyose/melibiose transport system permease protein
MKEVGINRLAGYLFVLPAALFYGAFVLLPVLATAGISFLTWDGLTPAVWNGLGNYLDLITDDPARTAVSNALILLVYFSFLPVLVGLLLTALMSRAHIRGLSAYRTVLFVPQILAGVVVGLIWTWVYAMNGGLLNQILGLLGLQSLQQAWLGSFDWTLHAVGWIGFWVDFGFCTVLFMAGVQKIPTDLYDAARVDGAGRYQEFRAVTLPGLRYEVAVALVLTVIAGMRNFDLVWNSSKGGPGYTSQVPSIEVYTRALISGEVGSGAALAIVVAALTLLLAMIILRIAEPGNS